MGGSSPIGTHKIIASHSQTSAAIMKIASSLGEFIVQNAKGYPLIPINPKRKLQKQLPIDNESQQFII
jgi:hypothetical protein